MCWLWVAFAWLLVSNFSKNSPSRTKLEFPQSLRVKGRRCLTFCDPQTRDQSGFQELPLPPGALLESWVWVKMMLTKKAALQHNLSRISPAMLHLQDQSFMTKKLERKRNKLDWRNYFIAHPLLFPKRCPMKRKMTIIPILKAGICNIKSLFRSTNLTLRKRVQQMFHVHCLRQHSKPQVFQA